MLNANSMTDIHERLQPVSEVGENGSNGEGDSITEEHKLVPIGLFANILLSFRRAMPILYIYLVSNYMKQL